MSANVVAGYDWFLERGFVAGQEKGGLRQIY